MYLAIIRASYIVMTHRVLTKVNRIKKIIKLLDSIEVIESNNTIYINIDKHILLNHTGSIILNSEDGYLITKHKRTHINPAIKINIVDTMDNITNANIKAELLRKQSLFSNLLKHKQIKYK